MKKEMYQMMYDTETYHWYFKAKYKIVLGLLKKYGLSKAQNSTFIDFGCGCGVMLKYLSHYGTGMGVDFSKSALDYCRLNFTGRLQLANLQEYHAKETYDFGIALDVLEHIEDDRKALRNIKEAIKENGICIFTVPAFSCLWTEHDQNCMHKRRYQKAELENKIIESGFQIEYCGYYNFWSFPVVFLIRKIENLFHVNNIGSKIEYGFKDGIINTILYKIFVSEKRRMMKEKTFPFGVSLICVARSIGREF